MTTLVGGVSQLYQGDLDLGRIAVARLAADDLGPGVAVEDLHYGAVAVAQRLEDLRPDVLVLVGAEARGRRPGTVERRRIAPETVDTSHAQTAVADAVTGYVAIDLVLEVAAALGALPRRTVAVEVEPAATEPADHLSATAETALDEALRLTRAEVRRAPLLTLADRLHETVGDDHLDPAPALDALRRLLDALSVLESEGRWGSAFAWRDELRGHIAAGRTGEGMTHLDWALWWGLIEELDRLQALDADLV